MINASRLRCFAYAYVELVHMRTRFLMRKMTLRHFQTGRETETHHKIYESYFLLAACPPLILLKILNQTIKQVWPAVSRVGNKNMFLYAYAWEWCLCLVALQ